MCFSLSFKKGVYFEKVLKSSDTSLWVRNIQMYLSGIVVTLAGVYLADGAQVIEKGFFYGYTPWVCFVVCESNSTLQTFYTITDLADALIQRDLQ